MGELVLTLLRSIQILSICFPGTMASPSILGSISVSGSPVYSLQLPMITFPALNKKNVAISFSADSLSPVCAEKYSDQNSAVRHENLHALVQPGLEQTQPRPRLGDELHPHKSRDYLSLLISESW